MVKKDRNIDVAMEKHIKVGRKANMNYIKKSTVLLVASILAMLLAACSSKDTTNYETLRDVSWEGTELTIKLGTNKSTGCVWTTDPQDDSVIDYSINRSFKLAGSEVKEGKTIGTLIAGFEGKGAGTTQIVCTTPVGWDGTGDGLTYIVTVTVNEDGSIKDAKGEESETQPASEQEQSDQTLEDYFNANPDELESIRKSIKEENSHKDLIDIDVEVKGNTLSYIYTFTETYSKDQIEKLKPDLESTLEQNAPNTKEGIKTMEEGFGVDDIQVYMEYRNGDGSKICGLTIE